jgi:hypothetical protein
MTNNPMRSRTERQGSGPFGITVAPTATLVHHDGCEQDRHTAAALESPKTKAPRQRGFRLSAESEQRLRTFFLTIPRLAPPTAAVRATGMAQCGRHEVEASAHRT